MKATRNDIVLTDGTKIKSYDIDFETDEEKREWHEVNDFAPEMNEYRQWWKQVGCKCPEHLELDAHFVSVGLGDPLCAKHHWVCNRCNGIVQVG